MDRCACSSPPVEANHLSIEFYFLMPAVVLARGTRERLTFELQAKK